MNFPFSSQAFFYCSIPTGEGCNGLAPVTLSTEVLTKLDPNVVEKFKEKQVRYHNCRPNEGKRFLSWQRTLGTKDRKVSFVAVNNELITAECTKTGKGKSES